MVPMIHLQERDSHSSLEWQLVFEMILPGPLSHFYASRSGSRMSHLRWEQELESSVAYLTMLALVNSMFHSDR